MSEHPHTGPLSQAESSAPGKPVYPERRISSQSFITGRHSPRRVPFQGQMVSTLARLKGFSLQWPCRARAAAASQSQAAQPEVTLSQGWSSHCPSLCSQQGQSPGTCPQNLRLHVRPGHRTACTSSCPHPVPSVPLRPHYRAVLNTRAHSGRFKH